MTEAVDQFKCLRCGNCCTIRGSVRLRGTEPETIAAHLNLSIPEFTGNYTDITPDRLGLKLKDHPDGSCIFLGSDRLCVINDNKPEQCKGFPLKWNYDDWKKVCSTNYPEQS